MSKRKTKAQREQEKRNALHQRVADIVSGACGRDMDSEDEYVQVEELTRVVATVRERLEIPEKALILSVWHWDKWDSVETLVDALLEQESDIEWQRERLKEESDE